MRAVTSNASLSDSVARILRLGHQDGVWVVVHEFRSRWYKWVLQYRWGKQRIQLLRTFLERFTVLPSSPDLCRKWAEVMVTAQAAGRRIESADAWIAATALLHDAPLLTNNRNDYLGVAGLTLVAHAS